MSESKNNTSSVIAIAPLGGVLVYHDMMIPAIIATMLVTTDSVIVCFIVFASCKAISAGSTSKVVISNIPAARMPTIITKAINISSKIFVSVKLFTRSFASSWLNVK